MPKVGFIVNPAAGRGSGRRTWDSMVERLRRDHDFTAWHTERPGHATDLARMAADQGYDRVAAVGGDGTLTEVLNGLVGTTTALGIVPAGTGNDFVRAVGIPMEAKAAAEMFMEADARPIDVGRINGTRYFINVAGIGFDAEVARTVNSYPKYLGGTIPYVAGIVTTLWRYRPVPLEIDLDGTAIDRKVLLMAVANATSYGGGMQICPDAKVNDGYFDVCIAGDVGRFEVLQMVPRIYSGGHLTHPKVEVYRARRVEVRATTPVATHSDGEVIGTTPVVFEMLPQNLQVIVPQNGGATFLNTKNAGT